VIDENLFGLARASASVPLRLVANRDGSVGLLGLTEISLLEVN
jgi:hypothetical protein